MSSKSAMIDFMDYVGSRHLSASSLVDYEDVYKWSVEDRDRFWSALWQFLEIIGDEKELETVYRRLEGKDCDVIRPEMACGSWFPGAKVNYAENVLRKAKEMGSKPALIFRDERMETRDVWSFAELEREVVRVATGLTRLGMKNGDVVAAMMPNVPETVIVALGATAIGCVWSSCSPDFGAKAIVDRFGQIEPALLVVCDGYRYKGKEFPIVSKVLDVVAKLPSLRSVVACSFRVGAGWTPEALQKLPSLVFYSDLDGSDAPEPFPFERTTLSHPLFVMFSSGTTGLPKCLVQGFGVYLNQRKEHVLHLGVLPETVMMFYTTCGWMMWNWMIPVLSSGETLVLYDGAAIPSDPLILWKISAQEKVTHFGTSARYIQALQDKSMHIRVDLDAAEKEAPFGALQCVLVTGSPSTESNFAYIENQLGPQARYISMSGGTDINGCWALGCPLKPIVPPELQCRGLGMPVEIWDEDGNSISHEFGELVCLGPVPCMPLSFWNDSPDQRRYYHSYFDKYGPSVWCHGDFACLTSNKGLIISGRSDTTLNPGGVRLGSADIYSVVESIPGIEDSLIAGQIWRDDERVILFVVLKSGHPPLDDDLRHRIRSHVRNALTPRHVPAKIVQVSDIPYTFNMKKVEGAVKRILNHMPVTNRDALRNPEVLDEVEQLSCLWAE